MKQILAILMLLTLLSSVASALDFTRDGTSSSPSGSAGGSSSTFTRPFPLAAGWNMIPYGEGISYNGNNEPGLKAAYIWSPIDNKYYDVLTPVGEEVLRKLTEQFRYTGIWVYQKDSVEDFRLTIDSDRMDQRIAQPNFTFPQGWNFYVILPQMLKAGYNGNFLNMGNEFMRAEKVYAWDRNSWEDGLFSSVQAQNDVVGIPFLVYYTAPFTPFMDKSVTPPAFPVENVR